MKAKKHQSRMRLSDIGQLQYAKNLADAGRWEDAMDVLGEFLERHPDNIAALELMLLVSGELQDPVAIWVAAWKLVRLSPKDENAYYALAASSMANALPFAALSAVEHYLTQWPGGEYASEVAEMKATIEPICAQIQADDPAAVGKSAADLALLDESNMLVSSGFYEEGREVCQRAITRLPDIPAPFNNLGLSYAIEGNLREALRTARQAVERFPENVHARCNLVQFLARTGNRTEADAAAAPLRERTDYRFDDLVKLIETFSYLGDDPTVVKLYESLKADQAVPIPPWTTHLAAVGYARTGDEKQARKLWKAALREDKTLQIAQENLDDLQKRPGERSGAWPFHIGYWVPQQWVKQLLDAVNVTNEAALQRRFERLLREIPELPAIAPMLLERGDPAGRQFALHLAAQTPVPGLREFVLSRHGTDDDRMQASQYATEYGLLPRGKPLPMYRAGKPEELLLMNYEIHDEPEQTTMPKAARRLLEQSVLAFREAKPEEARRLAQEGLTLAPNEPSLLNNVAAALGALGHKDEMAAMMRQLAEQHPDYLFARCGMARLSIEAGKLDEAQAWLDPLLERARFHHSEFDAVCIAQIELLEARGLLEGALSWLNMWEQTDPDTPHILMYRLRLMSKGVLRRGQGKKEGSAGS